MLLLGSGNAHKLAEISSLLADLAVGVVGADVLPPAPEIDETGDTFDGNARLKAIEYARRAARLPAPPTWVVADDSGLCVDALGDAPGVWSARYAGPGCTYADNNRKLLAALEGVDGPRRSACFVCTIACVRVPRSADADAEVLFVVEGRVSGRIAYSPRGEQGFGYDPVFIPEGSARTFAEMSAAEKNAISHRGRALAKFRAQFAKIVG